MGDTTDEQHFFIELAPELEGALVDAGVDLCRALQDQGLTVRYDRSAGSVASPGSKEIASAILAVGASTTMVAWAISKILTAFRRDKRLVATERSVKPVLDDAGQVVRDAGGRPVLYVTEETRVVDLGERPEEGTKISASAGTLLKFDLDSKT